MKRPAPSGPRVGALCLCMALVVSCRAGSDAAPAVSRDTLSIVSNTQATLDDVRIGAGNFWEDEYVGAAGEQKKGASAALWISVRDEPSGDRHIRVGSGSRFSAGRFAFEVLEVTSDTVRIRYAAKPPESP